MATCKSIPTDAVFVAIDISKYRHEVLIEVPGRKRRRRLTILNMLEDFDRLITVLTSFDSVVVVGFEVIQGVVFRDGIKQLQAAA